MSQVLRNLGLVFIALLFVSCSDDRAELFETQICLDKIDASQAQAALATAVDGCMAKISGQTSNEAYTLRCSGNFISEGIAEVALVNALKDLDGEGGGDDPTVAALEALDFQTIAGADAAVSNCSQSGSTSLTALAGLASMATIIKVAASTDLDSFIENYTPGSMSDAEKLSLANTIIASQDSLCEKDQGLMEGNEVCDNIEGAVAVGSATDAEKLALADQFMNNMKD